MLSYSFVIIAFLIFIIKCDYLTKLDYFKDKTNAGEEFYQVSFLWSSMYHGKYVSLRALEKTDINHIIKFYNEWNLRRWTGVPLPKSRHGIEIWLEKALITEPWKDGVIYFVIVNKNTHEFLGIARFYDIKSPHHRASLGVSIYDSEHRMKGYGTDATRLMLWVGFHVLGLHSIYLDTMENNERAIRVAEKAGFKKIGIFRETEFVDGEYKGLLYMDILRDEFMSKYPPGRTVEEKQTLD